MNYAFELAGILVALMCVGIIAVGGVLIVEGFTVEEWPVSIFGGFVCLGGFAALSIVVGIYGAIRRLR